MRRAALYACLALAPLAVADELRDPMRPPRPAQAARVAAEPVPVLSAIISRGGERLAILDGHLARAGDHVGAYAVDLVFVDGVRYHRAGIAHELHLASPLPIFKKAANAPHGRDGVP